MWEPRKRLFDEERTPDYTCISGLGERSLFGTYMNGPLRCMFTTMLGLSRLLAKRTRYLVCVVSVVTRVL